jgi:hypothetical protein
MMRKQDTSKFFIIMLIVLLAGFTLTFTLACSKNTPRDSQQQNHNTYSITMPGDWKEIQNGTRVEYLPEQDDAKNPFAEKVIIMVVFLPQNYTIGIKETLEAGLKANQDQLGIIVVSEEENVNLGHLNGAVRLRMVAPLNGEEMEYTQISAIAYNRIYTITHHCKKDQCMYTDIFNEMTDSFVEAIP